MHEVNGTTAQDWESSPDGRPWPDHDDAGGPDRIRIRGISVTGHHGVFEHERRDGQTFVADVVLHVDTRPAAAEDRLDLTVDYGAVASGVAAVLSGEPVDLIETVAERVAAVVLEHAGVTAVDVVLHKPQAPIPVPFADVTVEIHRSRSRPPVVGRRTGRHAAEAPTTPADPTGPGDRPAPPAGPVGVLGGLPFATVSPAAPVPVAVADVLAGVEVPGLADEPAGPGMPGPAVPDPDVPDPDVPDPSRPDPSGPDPFGPDPSAADVAAAPSSAVTAGALSEAPGDHLDVAPPGPVEVVLALGSNLGASEQTLREVLHDLAAVDGLELTAVSPLVRTAPVGGPEQPDYLNAVVIARTTLAPRALLRACQAIESGHGRERLVRWGPRTVDIDIVVHGSTLAVTDDLELPHPRAHARAFVLQPWAEIAPDAVLPGLGGGPVAQLARTAPDRDGIRWMALDWWAAPEAG